MSEALTEQNLALWQSCGLVLLAMDGKPPNVFHDVRGLDSATMNRLLDAARAEGSANLSKVMEENARLREALEPFAKVCDDGDLYTCLTQFCGCYAPVISQPQNWVKHVYRSPQTLGREARSPRRSRASAYPQLWR